MTNVSSRPCRTLVLLIFVATTLGCTTLRPVVGTDPQAVSEQVSVGDRIEITHQDHGVSKFKVDEITESGIGGGGIFVDYRDIRLIRSSEIHVGKTAFGIVGGTAIVLVLALMVAGPTFTPGP